MHELHTVEATASQPPHAPGNRDRARPFLGFGLLLMTYAVANAAAGQVLGVVFEWPDILRRPAAEVLPRYAAQMTVINGAYYVFLATSILLIAIALGLRRVLDPQRRTAHEIFATFGVLAGVFQILGWVRWPFTVRRLAELYEAAGAGAATRAAVEVAYEHANYYAGVAVGEHLGFVFQAVWTVAVGIYVLRSSLAPRWVGWLGIVAGVLFEVGDFGAFLLAGSPAGEALAILFVPAYVGAILFVGVVGFFLTRARTLAGSAR